MCIPCYNSGLLCSFQFYEVCSMCSSWSAIGGFLNRCRCIPPHYFHFFKFQASGVYRSWTSITPLQPMHFGFFFFLYSFLIPFLHVVLWCSTTHWRTLPVLRFCSFEAASNHSSSSTSTTPPLLRSGPGVSKPKFPCPHYVHLYPKHFPCPCNKMY
jgi:hypothetical protein